MVNYGNNLGIITRVCYWYEYSQGEQWNQTESPKIEFHVYNKLIFKKIPKYINGERLVSKNYVRKIKYLIGEKRNNDLTTRYT